MNLGFYSAGGTLVEDLGQLAAGQSRRIQLPDCGQVHIGAKAPFVTDWAYWQTWTGRSDADDVDADLHNFPKP